MINYIHSIHFDTYLIDIVVDSIKTKYHPEDRDTMLA